MEVVEATQINSFGLKIEQSENVLDNEHVLNIGLDQLQDTTKRYKKEKLAIYYVSHAEKMAETIELAMNNFSTAVELLPSGKAKFRDSLRNSLLRNGEDPIQAIRIILAHTKEVLEVLL